MRFSRKTADGTDTEPNDDASHGSGGRRLGRALAVAALVGAGGYLAWRAVSGSDESEFTEIEIEPESAAVDS
jgi:hypothetical protein